MWKYGVEMTEVIENAPGKGELTTVRSPGHLSKGANSQRSRLQKDNLELSLHLLIAKQINTLTKFQLAKMSAFVAIFPLLFGDQQYFKVL